MKYDERLVADIPIWDAPPFKVPELVLVRRSVDHPTEIEGGFASVVFCDERSDRHIAVADSGYSPEEWEDRILPVVRNNFAQARIQDAMA